MPQNSVPHKSPESGRKERTREGPSNSNPIGFVYKTMLERDPKKRKVKPTLNEKSYDFMEGLEETSSDDSDYRPKEVGDGDDLDDDLDDDGDEEEEEEDSDDDEQETEQEKGNLSALALDPNHVNSDHLGSPHKLDLAAKARKLLVCCVCLGDVSHESDEIVECDSCGITVHEGCYGVTSDDTDVESIHSNASSSSTEPWFCDACKGGNTAPVCELCPNPGGIFKQTDVGRWVHLVCALYIPGVAFADTSRLTGVTLFELSYEKYGAKVCSLCEDDRVARTGICVSCDAGMCRTHFHVTCAQREGLLYEATGSTEETEMVDPFYAHCKIHAGDKAGVKAKRRNFMALQSKLRMSQQTFQITDRIKKKLEKAKEKWSRTKENKPEPWVPTHKISRMITTSPVAVKKLIKKAELLGLSPQHNYLTSHELDVRRKWHIAPAFNVEFVSYYMDRNNRMSTMRKRLEESKSQNKQLKESEVITRQKYEELIKENDKLKTEGMSLRDGARNFWSMLGDIAKTNIRFPKLLESPEKKADRKSTGGRRAKKRGAVEEAQDDLGSEQDRGHRVVLNKCGICKESKDQHQLALCDNCKLYYHLYCLDPPLTRMPKKTRFGGWQCSDCTEKEDTQSPSEPDASNQSIVDAPRRLREHVKGPNKFVPDADITPPTTDVPKKKRGRPLGRKNRVKKVKVEVNISEGGSVKSVDESSTLSVSAFTTPVVALEPLTPQLMSPTKKSPRAEYECDRCKENENLKLMVQCDACDLYYHFMCLDPPVKKSPKQRGYQWFCQKCDESDSDDDNEDGDDEGGEDEDEDGEEEDEDGEQEVEEDEDEGDNEMVIDEKVDAEDNKDGIVKTEEVNK